MSLRDSLLALVVVVIWGINFTVIKLSLAEAPPLLVAALRFFFAAVPAILFVPRPKGQWRYVIGYGLAMGTTLYGLLNLALAIGMPASLASLVLQVQAMFTMFIAFLVLGERPRPLQLAGAAIAFAGIAVVGYGRFEGAAFFPLLVTVAAAVAWGAANVISKSAGRIHPLGFTAWGNLVSVLPLLALSFAFEGGDRIAAALLPPSLELVGLVLVLAYPATLFGFAIWSGLLSRYPASTVAPFTLLVPIAGITSGMLVLGEPIFTLDIVGGLLILVGLGFTVVRIRRRQLPLQPGA